LHGGANEEVLIQLAEIGDPANVDSAVQAAKDGSRRLMGFGHRVYKNYDPRATIIREAAHSVLESSGSSDPLLEVAMRLEKAALSDEYFIARKLYPNVDFYSGLIYRALGFNTDEFTVLFALGRCVGWLAHCAEQLDDPEQRIIRPRQIYTGRDQRSV
jgi:citrate synthase